MTEERLNGHKIKQLHTLTGQRLGKTLEQLNLTPTQSHVLSYLVEHQGQDPCPRDVEEFFSLTHPTVSGILSRLEAKGYVAFRLDREDRRCKRIHVTNKARTCHAQIRAHIEALEEEMVRDFTPAERAAFADLLGRAIQNLGGESGTCQKLHEKEESRL